MKASLCILTLFLVISNVDADSKKLSGISWTPQEWDKSLMLPDGFFVSKFGKGQYRIDCFGNPVQSHGHFNCIYIFFQSSGNLSPTSVLAASETSFSIKGRKMTWRTYPNVIEGHSIIRKEILIPNILPREQQDKDGAYIWLRIDGDTTSVVEQLTPIAEGIIRDASNS